MRWRWDFLSCTVGHGQFKDWSWRALIESKPEEALAVLSDERIVLHPEVSAAVNDALEEAHEEGRLTRQDSRSSNRARDVLESSLAGDRAQLDGKGEGVSANAALGSEQLLPVREQGADGADQGREDGSHFGGSRVPAGHQTGAGGDSSVHPAAQEGDGHS